MNLARANSLASGGKRYGQDFYDYRMQALRIVYVVVFPHVLIVSLSLFFLSFFFLFLSVCRGW